MAFHCPHCQAKVYSRRNNLCSTCRGALPADFLYSLAELEAVEAEERERERQARLREERRSSELEERRRRTMMS